MFSNACYKFNPEKKYWKTADDTCEQAGGKLTSIHSQEELDFIRMLIDSSDGSSPSTWIGGERKNEKSFGWIDYTPFDFSNWDKPEPNNLGGNENCIEIFTAPGQRKHNKFNDIRCMIKRDFICKKLLKGGRYFKIYLRVNLTHV